MMLFSSIIQQYEQDFLAQYAGRILASHRKALSAMKTCRTQLSPRMLASCSDCSHQSYVPHSCGHRNCPHCQAHESQQWLERQLKKQVPAEYFLLTFTLPAQLRPLAWCHQREIYSMMIQCCWETLRTFSENDQQLQGTPGVISVLHTHSRCLDFHPHVHIVVLPKRYPEKWVVDCKSVGTGDKALIYLGRYLYRGVIQEKDIVACDKGKVTFRHQDSKTKQTVFKTVTGAKFLWLVLQHVLPKGFRRARNFGFLHPNSKRLILLLQYLLRLDPDRALAWIRKRPQWACPCCGAKMRIIKTRLPALFTYQASSDVITGKTD